MINMIHEIKLDYQFQKPILEGDKIFEVRYNDRGYQKGDLVKFHVVNRENIEEPIENQLYEITYVLAGWGIKEGYVVFGIRRVDGNKY